MQYSKIGFIYFKVSWFLYKGSRGSQECMAPDEFYYKLTEQLIDNRYNTQYLSQQATQAENDGSDLLISGVGPHLTLTTRKKEVD